MEPNSQSLFQLENVVRFVREKKAPVNRITLLRKNIVTATGLTGISRFIRRADKVPQPEERVDCISIGPETIGPNQIYDCKRAQCPLLIEGKCKAEQETRTRNQRDDRVHGASQRPFTYGRAPKRSTPR